MVTKIASTPKYKVLLDLLTRDLLPRHRKTGSRLPSEQGLAAQYGISVGTVRRAMAELVTRGLLVKKQGHGTFIAHGRRAQSFTLGLVLTDIRNPFFSELARGIQEESRSLGYSVMYYNTDDSLAREAEAVDMLIARRVDGVILVPLLEAGEQGILQRLRDEQTPYLYLDRRPAASRGDFVGTDNAAGVRAAMVYLRSLGHIRIGCISAQPHTVNLSDRVAAYTEMVDGETPSRRAPAVRVSRLRGDEGGYEAARSLLTLSRPPTAIVAVNDTIAIGAVRAAGELGVRIPQDLSIVGFDDIRLSARLPVPLTTVQQPIEEMSRVAVRTLWERVTGAAGQRARSIVLAPRLVVRKSCAAVSPSVARGGRIAAAATEGGSR